MASSTVWLLPLKPSYIWSIGEHHQLSYFAKNDKMFVGSVHGPL